MVDQAGNPRGAGEGNRDERDWPKHWKAVSQPWRKSPPVDAERARILASRHRVTDGQCCYDLGSLTLSRADVEWLLAEHPAKGCGTELSLLGADLRGVNLSALPLDAASLRGARLGNADLRRASLADADLSTADLQGADCREANLQGANLTEAQLDTARLEGASLMRAVLAGAELAHARLEGANLHNANLEKANLLEANLDKANLNGAYLTAAKLLGASLRHSSLHWGRLRNAELTDAALQNAVLPVVDLQGASLVGAHLDCANLTDGRLEGADLTNACLQGTDLTRAYFDSTTRLDNIDAGAGGKRPSGGITVADVHWNGANLSVIDWSKMRVLGDEVRARTAPRRRDALPQARSYATAARANRQLAQELQDQGMTEEANRFAYRAQVMQRKALYHGHKPGQYLFSLFLSILSGYGYRFGRSFLAYLVVIGSFALAYRMLGPKLNAAEAFVISMTAFHGRGFFPGTFAAADPLAIVSAGEAFVGLVIEVVLIATMTQRLFGR